MQSMETKTFNELLEDEFGVFEAQEILDFMTAYAVQNYGNQPGIVLVDGVWKFFDLT